jgi:tRNA (cytidine/uridine-2'-O-)-methyltransferase
MQTPGDNFCGVCFEFVLTSFRPPLKRPYHRTQEAIWRMVERPLRPHDRLIRGRIVGPVQLNTLRSGWQDFAASSGPGDSMRIALYQPDIPQNTGTILRLAACLGVAVDVIGPAGFDLSNAALRRAGMDYIGSADLTRHDSWQTFLNARGAHATDRADQSRLILLSSKASVPHITFDFRPTDILLLGRESAGVPDHVRDACDSAVRIPMRTGLRSLNIAVAGAMVLGEALRQTDGFTG